MTVECWIGASGTHHTPSPITNLRNPFEDSQKFSPDLFHRVTTAIERCGYCIFGVEEMNRLLIHVKGGHAKAQALQEFARICGVEVETTPHLTSASFRKAV